MSYICIRNISFICILTSITSWPTKTISTYAIGCTITFSRKARFQIGTCHLYKEKSKCYMLIYAIDTN